MTDFTRADDEMHLEWLTLADQGYSATQIARKYRTTKGSVIGMISRIRKATLEEGKPT